MTVPPVINTDPVLDYDNIMNKGFTDPVIVGQTTAGVLSVGSAEKPSDMPVRSKVLDAAELARRAGDVDVSKCLGGGTAYNAENMHDSIHIPGDASEQVNKVIAHQREREFS